MLLSSVVHGMAVSVLIAAPTLATYDTHNATGLASSQVLIDPFPYWDPQVNATAAQLFAMPQCHGVKLEDATIDELQAYQSNGTLTSEQLVTCYMQRYLQTDQYIKYVLHLESECNHLRTQVLYSS